MLPQNKRPPDIGEYVNANSIDAALAALADGQATLLAGGSDLWAQKDSGNGRIGRRLVNVNRVPDLRGISESAGRIRIGALTTMSEILESDLLARRVPVLVDAADHFASPQIRNVASVGGNIANASPAADMVLPLIVLDAVARVRSVDGERDIPVSGVAIAPGKTCLRPEELITAVEFETPSTSFHAAFQKSGSRPALEISIVAMCLGGGLAGSVLADPRLVFGAVGPTAIRCRKTESLIGGRVLTDDLIARALDAMAGEIAPIDDVRASVWYRTHVARTFLKEELSRCRQA
ncbi:MAG: FAD binding domain-containing protein [Paracoccaceae bacterium]